MTNTISCKLTLLVLLCMLVCLPALSEDVQALPPGLYARACGKSGRVHGGQL